MKNVLKNTVASAILMTMAMPALAMSDASMQRIIAMGFDREVVNSLSDAQVKKVEQALSNGSDSDARMAVNSILLNAIMMEMMDK